MSEGVERGFVIALWTVIAWAASATVVFFGGLSGLPAWWGQLSSAGAAAGGALVVVSAFPVALIAGVPLGLLACAFVVPLLAATRLRRSLPFVLGVSSVGALVVNEVHALGAVGTCFGLQAVLGFVAHSRAEFQAVRPPVSACVHCGFDCRGVTAAWCPECGFGGPEWAVRNPELCGACGRALGGDGQCAACGVTDFNAADWREVVKSSKRSRDAR